MSQKELTRGAALVQGTRLPFATASVLPGVFVYVWIWIAVGRPETLYALPALLGILFLQLGANTINDYFDWEESDRVNTNANTFNGGSRHAVGNLLGRRAFLAMALLFFGAAIGSGIFLALMGRPWVLLMGASGGGAGVLYSVKPFSFQSRGLGELIIFLAFGPLVTLGMGYVLTGVMAPEFFYLGIPNGFVVTAILWINEFPDYDADLATGKRNLVVRLGLKSSRYGYLFLVAGMFLSTAVLVGARMLPMASLAIFLLLPVGVLLTRAVWRHYADPGRLLPVQGGTVLLQTLAALLLTFSLLV